MVLRSHELPREDFENYDNDGFEWSAAEELSSGERICAPLNEPRGSTFWPAALVIAVALTAGVVIAQFPEATTAVKDTASALLTEAAPQPAPQAQPEAAPIAPQAALPPPVAATDVAAVPGATAGEAAAPSEAVSAPSAATPPETETETAAEAPAPGVTGAALEPLPKPVADPKDLNQKRALAAGLHPDVSKALLAKMTAADFSSVRLAVQTALAETEDSATLIWPKAAAAKDAPKGAAQFEVKFVAGAAPDCRRYVVIVTKDRWSTTAPPMEACGAELPKRRLASKVG